MDVVRVELDVVKYELDFVEEDELDAEQVR